MSDLIKNVVLVHGGFVDGSGWRQVHELLTSDGYRVSVVQNPTLSLAGDVEATLQVLRAQDGPCVLVGHSYGGAVVSEAGTDDSVAALKQQYLARKRIDLKLLEPVAFAAQTGVEIVLNEDYRLVLEVDTRQQPIEPMIAQLMRAAQVADISIEDPPLEEIIAALYRRGPTGQ